MKATVLMALLMFVANFAHAKNPFLGEWCPTEEHKYSKNFEKLVINEDNSLLRLGLAAEVESEWEYKYSSDSGLLAADPKFKFVGGVKTPHSSYNDGVSVIFNLSPDGRMVWSGPIKTAEFQQVTKANMGELLLMDARVYKMTYERCDFIGF